MLSKISKRARWVLASCAVVTTTSAGCRNSMPGMNMFGWNRTPSAETLAGSGPTTTYPSPPSDSATPEAIASVAGGTSENSDAPVTKPAATENASPAERVAALGGPPSYASAGAASSGGSAANPAASPDRAAATEATSSTASPTAAPNMAAARANGILGKMRSASAAAPSYAQPASATDASSGGYQFGQRAGGGGEATTASESTTGTGYTLPASLGTPKASADKAGSSSAAASGTNGGGSGGYTLPSGMSPSDSAAPQNAPATEATGQASAPTEDAPGETPAAAADTPAYSTAAQPDASDVPTASPSGSTGGSGGYQPGSTGGATGYPSGGYQPSTSGGSFYR